MVHPAVNHNFAPPHTARLTGVGGAKSLPLAFRLAESAVNWLRLLTSPSGFTGGKWCRDRSGSDWPSGNGTQIKTPPPEVQLTVHVCDRHGVASAIGQFCRLPPTRLEYRSPIGCGACPSGGGRGARCVCPRRGPAVAHGGHGAVRQGRLGPGAGGAGGSGLCRRWVSGVAGGAPRGAWRAPWPLQGEVA